MKVSIIDWIIKKLKRCIAIVEEGNTASQAIGSGKYVMWKGNLYTADSAISSGTTLAASGGSKNLTAVADGGYNDLNGKISTLNSKLTNLIKVVDVDLNNFAIGTNGYSSITNPSTPSGYVLLYAEVHSATYSAPADFPTVEGRGAYVYGTASKTYTQITIRFIYIMI